MASHHPENLVPIMDRTPEERREIARKAGIASGEAKRKKKAMREMLEVCLEMTDKKTGKTYRELATMGLINGAIKGNALSYRTIVETLGELKLEDDQKQYELSKVEELLLKIENEAKK